MAGSHTLIALFVLMMMNSVDGSSSAKDPVIDSCIDISPNCALNVDECDTEPYVQENCKKTCNLCNIGIELDSCIDISPNCALNVDECDTDPYVQENCKKTCNLCNIGIEPDSCIDIIPNCALNVDECDTDPYIQDYCKKTCNLCNIGIEPEFNKASTSQQCPLHLSFHLRSEGELIEQKYSTKCDTCYTCDTCYEFNEATCRCEKVCYVTVIKDSPFCTFVPRDAKCRQCPECPVKDCQTYNPSTCRCDIKFLCRARYPNLRTCSDPKATYIEKCDMCAACPDKCQSFNKRLCKCQIATGWSGCQNSKLRTLEINPTRVRE